MSPAYPDSTPGIISLPRLTTLFTSLLVALSSGTNYVYSAYAPQLGARLHITHTQLNIVGLAGNVGVYSSGPVWGRVVDTRGPRIPLAGAFLFLLMGYTGIRWMYDAGLSEGEATLSTLGLLALIACSYLTGAGGNGGLTGGLNSTAKSFPDKSRATTTGIVISGFGLSAFLFSSLSHHFYAGNTSAFLLLLSLGTALPMIIGFFLIRPIPLPPKERIATLERAEDDSGSEDQTYRTPVHVNGSQLRLLDHDALDSRGAEGRIRLYSPDVLGAEDELESPAPTRHERSASRDRDGLPNVYGIKLLKSFDFWLLFVILSMLSGTGLMYINNVGSMSQALFAHNNPAYDEIEAAKWQSTQVSSISLMNFAGRIFIGLTADHIKHTHSLPRSYCLVLVSFFFFCSQVAAALISDIRHLWISSALLGLAHGSVFSLFPTVCIEFFGMPHFSENWGYLSTAPMIAGNLFSVAFGRNLDAHESPASSQPASMLAPQCLEGLECYVDTLYITIGATFLSMLLSVCAGYRDWKEMESREELPRRRSRSRSSVVWDAGNDE